MTTKLNSEADYLATLDAARKAAGAYEDTGVQTMSNAQSHRVADEQESDRPARRLTRSREDGDRSSTTG